VVMRPILSTLDSVNHSAPSGPVVIPARPLPAVRTGYSVITPAVVMRPILLAADSVNQSAPSGPAVIAAGPLAAVGIGTSGRTPRGVIRPMALVDSVNHNAPSMPGAMRNASAPDERGNSVRVPAVVIRPILPDSANQSAPSEPVAIPPAVVEADIGYSV